MSSGDRVAVPTNGHRPALHDDALDSPYHDASASGDRRAEPGSALRERVSSRSPQPPALPTMTASQIVAGVGVLATVALLLLGRRRGRG